MYNFMTGIDYVQGGDRGEGRRGEERQRERRETGEERNKIYTWLPMVSVNDQLTDTNKGERLKV